ncbi:hypothetical protein BC828DRAFT_376719 [Blastocladiella britannica]|nr:hypothetical protein BC828DRAFT_376719 [Blastocladiella britannica]
MHLQKLAEELVAGILAVATPNAALLASNTELYSIARLDPVLPIAWAHHLLAATDASIMNLRPHTYDLTPAEYNARFCPDTRTLPTPATWLMQNLLRGLHFRRSNRKRHQNVPQTDLELAPSPFTVPAVVSYMLLPRRFWSAADTPLDEAVRAWDAPTVRDVESELWTFDAPEPLATRLATPALRPVPEALQLPLLYLYTGEIARFFDTTRRLVTLLPTLTTATASITLWMRLGLDSTGLPSSAFSIHRSRNDDVVADDSDSGRITLPMYWAVVAVSEGRVDVLDHLVSELAVDPRALTAFLSTGDATNFVFNVLMPFSAADRVIPTWHWLVNHGYVYPAAELDALIDLTGGVETEYATLQTLFHECDRPSILAATDLDERRETYSRLSHTLRGWIDAGYHDLLHEFADLGILTPRGCYELFFQWRDMSTISATTLPLAQSVAWAVEGGMKAIVDHGLDAKISSSNTCTAIELAHLLFPTEFSDLVAAHATRPGFLHALLSLDNTIQSHMNYASLIHLTLSQFQDPTSLLLRQPRVPAVRKLFTRALCDTGELGVSTRLTLTSVSPAARVRLFAAFAHTLPDLDMGRGDWNPHVPDDCKTPAGWLVPQYVLDCVLPDHLDSPDDLAGNARVMALVRIGTRAYWNWNIGSPDGDSDDDGDSEVVEDDSDDGDAAETNGDEVKDKSDSNADDKSDENGDNNSDNESDDDQDQDDSKPDQWSADLTSASEIAALALDNDRYYDMFHEWVAARFFTLAPHVVMRAAKFTAYTSAWVWQARYDMYCAGSSTSNNDPEEGTAWRPVPLHNWIGIVGTAIANDRRAAARLVMSIARHEQGDQHELAPSHRRALEGMAKKWPDVLDLACAAGFVWDPTSV